MRKLLINATQSDELRVAIVDQQKHMLVDLDIEQPGNEQKKSNIYKGKISSIERSLGAVFVDYGSDKHGFLPIKDISKEYFLTNDPISHDMDISKVLKTGQELVVQIDKEERGNKGAALTTFISLAGSYLVLMPNNPRAGGISRRIEGDDRQQLRSALEGVNVPEGMGIIIRTAGVGRSAEELNWDMEVLLRYWDAIKKAAIAKPGPYLIHQESDVVIRAVRDYLKQDISEIIVDEPNTFDRVKNYISQVRPDYTDHLKLYDSQLPLFSQYRIEQQIEHAFQREVRLPSGGSLVIDHSEALVAIDINSARATKGGNIEETAFNTNMEAAVEIPRQLRIRDIGGLVVIDFIDMISNSNQRAVEDKVRDAVKQDRARIQIGKISRFGLLEMSRQRINASLNKSTQVPCTHCHGRGTIRSVESLTLAILRLIEEESVKAGSANIQVQLPMDCATFLLNEKRDTLNKIQAQTGTQIVIIPNPHLQSPHYNLKLVKDEHGKNTLSYKQVKLPKAEGGPKRTSKSTLSTDAPAIDQFLNQSTSTKPPRSKRQAENSLIKRIWDTIFGLNEEPTPPPARTTKTKQSPRKSTGSTAGRKKQPAKRASKSTEKKENTNTSKAKTGEKSTTSRRGNRAGRAASQTSQATTKPAVKRRPANKKKTTPSSSKPQKSVKASEKTSSQSEINHTNTPSKKTAIQSSKPAAKPTANKRTASTANTSTPSNQANTKAVTSSPSSTLPIVSPPPVVEPKKPVQKQPSEENKKKSVYAKPEDYILSSPSTGTLKQIKTQKTKAGTTDTNNTSED